MATKLGLSPGAISLWEKGKGFPYEKNYEKISEVTGYSVAFLEGREDDSPSKAATVVQADGHSKLKSPHPEDEPPPRGVDAQSFIDALARQQAQTDKILSQTDRLIALLEGERDKGTRLTDALIAEREFQRKREERQVQAAEKSTQAMTDLQSQVKALQAKIDKIERVKIPHTSGGAA